MILSGRNDDSTPIRKHRAIHCGDVFGFWQPSGGVMKKLPTTLEGQLLEIVRQGFKDELPRSKTRGRRNGNDLPLTAWMEGAPAKSESKITEVCNGNARYPYQQVGAGAQVLIDRIAMRYKVTWVQHAFIECHVLDRYRGKARQFTGFRITEYLDSLGPQNTTQAMSEALWIACGQLKKSPWDLPLSVLIDDRVTNLLLLIELAERTRLAKKGNRHGRATTYDVR